MFLKKNKFLYDLQLQSNHLEMDNVFLNVLVSLNAPLIDVYAVKMVFCAIQNVTKINSVLVLINNVGNIKKL